MATSKKGLYPVIDIKRIKNPSRFYAIPLLGWIIKVIMLIPVWIYYLILSFAAFFVLIINSFYILFTGKYWDVAYALFSRLIRYCAKMTFFLFGLTDTYPGFNFEIKDNYSIAIPQPKRPSRFYAIPLLGFLIRLLLAIPYLIYLAIIGRAAWVAAVVGSFFVVFTGKYPESDFEINRDAFRLSMGFSMWLTGLSDDYPSFWISMNHMVIKIVLIVIGVLLTFANYGSRFGEEHRSRNMNYYQYHNDFTPNSYYYQK